MHKKIKKSYIIKLYVIILISISAVPALPAETPDAQKETVEFNARGIRMRKLDMSTLVLYSSVSFYAKHSSEYSQITKGTVSIRETMGKAVNAVKPGFWIVSDLREMDAVMKEALKIKSEAIRDQASAQGVIKYNNNIVMILNPDISFDWFSRILFMEYTRYLMNSLAPAAKNYNIGWFYSGLSSYIGWKAAAREENKEELVFQNELRNYYASFFNPAEASELINLESPEQWKKTVSENPAQAFAQSVLIYQYLAQNHGDESGINVLKLFNSESYFEDAFKRIYKKDLKEFEAELKEKLYPEIEKLRGSKGP
jgi:hypothetical protein